MSDFELHSMEKVVAFIGEADEQARREMRHVLTHAGMKQVSTHANLANLASLLGQVPPDLIVLAADLDPGVFDFIRNIRHNTVGTNPFMVIMTVVAADDVEAVKRAMQAGTDDIIIKPAKEEQILQRLKRVMMNRLPFIVTSDYVGPDRRVRTRSSAIRRINVINTMLDKATGKMMDIDSMRDAIDSSMHEMLLARLDSHGLRVGFLCNLILEAYKNPIITDDVREKLRVLVDVLKDAAKTAERVQEPELALMSGSLSGDVARMVERYAALTERDLGIIQKLPRAVVSTVKPRAAPDKLEEETRRAAATYQARQRGDFNATQEIHRAPGEAPVVAMDEPVIEILPLPKGKYLFKQGDPATSAYILNSGVIGIFKEVDGKRQPIARVKKGEFFGEMAIIDGRPRRNSALALEDCTLSLVSKEMIEEKLGVSDSIIRTLLHMLTNSLRMVHEAYAPKGRNILDAVRDMKDQAKHIQAHVDNGSPELRKDATAAAKKAADIADAIVKLIESAPELDRRTAAIPSEKDLQD